MMSRRDSLTCSPSTLDPPSSFLRLARRWGLVLLWTAGIFILSSSPHPLGPLSRLACSEAIGRIAHAGEYAGLVALLYRAVARGEGGRRASLVSLGLALAYALFDELHQQFTPGRDCELADLGYDLVGMTVALGLIWVRKRFERHQSTHRER